MVPSNEANMLSGIGLIGEGFVYPGHEDSNSGFSRFSSSGPSTTKLHPLHMSHNVTLDECDEIVKRHQLLAPHGVWLVHEAHEDDFASAERLGDCGLFLGARSSVDADIWRAFYQYARMILRLGHVDTWFDDDIVHAIVHSSSEKLCNSATSKVCLWWSEFSLDDELYSCRPKRDASNIVTPSMLLATLAENNVAYPPPNPPPPEPPASPPPPLPPPGALRCELSAIASTSGYKVPAYDANLDRYVPVQQKCWRWDAGNDWPPFVAHRDLYVERDRCSGARSRDVQWDGGFKQSLLASGTFDPLYQNNDDCALKSHETVDEQYASVGQRSNGASCTDGGDETQSSYDNNKNASCDLGTNLQSCGVRKNLVVFGFASLLRYESGTASAFDSFISKYGTNHPYYKTSNGFGRPLVGACIMLPGMTDSSGNDIEGKWGMPSPTSVGQQDSCKDGGPGQIEGVPECYYGTHGACGKRRFAFRFEDAGPDMPDDSCVPGSHEYRDTLGALVDISGPNNGKCEDGLMWSIFAPGKNPCPPNTDLYDCGYRPAKRYARVGKTLNSNTCINVSAYVHNPMTHFETNPEPQLDIAIPCADCSDDVMHGHDLRLKGANNAYTPSVPDADEQCGRGTQTQVCLRAGNAEVKHKLNQQVDDFKGRHMFFHDKYRGGEDGQAGTLAYNTHRHHDKATYINPNLAGKGACVSPRNLLANVNGELVRPRLFHTAVGDFGSGTYRYQAFNVLMDNTINYPPQADLVQEYTVWFGAGRDLDTNLAALPNQVCSDSGEGSFRVPFRFGQPPSGFLDAISADTKFFYDFACPYGSQPDVCPPREGLEEYQKTMDELEQPSGPTFVNCFDEDVPDFECCRAETSFRIHGGEGVVGHLGSEQLQYCALDDFGRNSDEPNLRTYVHVFTGFTVGGRLFRVENGAVVGLVGDLSLAQCKARCDNFEGYISDPANLVPCESFNYKPDNGECKLFAKTGAYFDFSLTGSAQGLGASQWALHADDSNGAVWSSFINGDFYYATEPKEDYIFEDVYENTHGDKACPVHWTSYHHTTTGCKAFCRAAFQRDGDDNTCMPGKPECANWLDSNDFPTEQYVTVNAECICGAKLEEYQDSGKYVHTGTVLQDTRKRALHEDDGVEGGDWEWPDAVSAGIDQFHGKTFIASLEHIHTHTHTHTYILTQTHTRFVCRRAF